MGQRTRGLDEREQIILRLLECWGNRATQGERVAPRLWLHEWVTEGESRRSSPELRVSRSQVAWMSFNGSGLGSIQKSEVRAVAIGECFVMLKGVLFILR